MEIKIEDYLQKIYTFHIEVNFKDFRKYEIKFKIDNKEISISYSYDVTLTFEANIDRIIKIIDYNIPLIFRRCE